MNNKCFECESELITICVKCNTPLSELVRYGMNYNKFEDEWTIDPKENGQYVKYHEVAEIINQLRAITDRPSVLHKPTIVKDGNAWLAILGDLSTGVVGCGNTPNEAMLDFDKEWYKTAARTKAAKSNPLKPFEKQIIKMLIDGKMYKDIARELDYVPKYVQTLIAQMRVRLQCRTVSQVIGLAMKENWL